MAEAVVDQLVASGMLVEEVMMQLQDEQAQQAADMGAGGIANMLSDRAGGAAEVIGGPERGLEGMMGGGAGGRVPVGTENTGMTNAGV